MVKDHSRRPSVEAFDLLPQGNKPEEPPAQAPTKSEDTIMNAPPCAPAIEGLNKAADTEAQAMREATSQPMTASNSMSSNPSSKDVGTGAAPYGTRSRNRTGNSRPNYAEDKEMDADFEIAPSGKETGRKAIKAADAAAAAAAAQSNALEPGKSVPSTKKSNTIDNEQVTMQNHHKDPIPGTSTFSANPTTPSATAQPSKKRKANGQPTTTASQPQAQPAATSNPSIQAVTRRASMAAQVAAGFRESNMLTFDNCGARLKDKKLVADDGTILQVNGESARQFLRPCSKITGDLFN